MKTQTPDTGGSALAVAIQFHETYERLAPSFGYETRKDTKAFDPESANGASCTKAGAGHCDCGRDAASIAVSAALSPGAGTGWLPANEAEKLRAELAELRAALEYASRASNSPADIQAFAEVLRGNGGNWSAIDAARAGEEGAKCKRCEGTGKVALSREPCCTEEITCPDCKGSDNAGGAKV